MLYWDWCESPESGFLRARLLKILTLELESEFYKNEDSASLSRLVVKTVEDMQL